MGGGAWAERVPVLDQTEGLTRPALHFQQQQSWKAPTSSTQRWQEPSSSLARCTHSWGCPMDALAVPHDHTLGMEIDPVGV